MAEFADRKALESRIADLEAQLERFSLFPDKLAAFSSGSCTNNCTAACTIGCTSGCTGGCVADASIDVVSRFKGLGG